MFNINITSYDLNMVFQPSIDKLIYDKTTCKYYSMHLWNLLPNDIKKSIEIITFTNILKMGRANESKCYVWVFELTL